MSEVNNFEWPDEIRKEMIERSKLYDHDREYQYGYYDGWQKQNDNIKALETKVKELEVYTEHDYPCMKLAKDGDCTCGLDDIIRL